VNPDRVAELHAIDPRLTTPKTWEDLTGSQWFGHLSLADPSKSGSVKTSYEMILQQYGWEKGWRVLVELFANAALIRESGAIPADDVASAEAVAGIVIDFYGRLQVSRSGSRAAQFIVPEGGTALDSDPIAMLRGAPHPELAARFIRFVVSPEGQRLWVNKPHIAGASFAGVPAFRGPEKTPLGRMAVLPELYTRDVADLFDARNPFESKELLRYNAAAAAARNSYLGDLIKTALIDNHAALTRARKHIASLGDSPRLLDELTVLPEFVPVVVRTMGNENVLEYGVSTPLKTDSLPALAKQYSPSKDREPALYPFLERLQTAQKDAWRMSFAERFARLASQ
jgi:hypothetical protein